MKTLGNRKIFGGAILLYLVTALGAAQAATYWASPQGSNSASCADITGSSDPGRYGSVARAVACATRAGDVAMVKPGIYTSNVIIINPSSGITIRGSDSNRANWPVLRPVGGTGVRMFYFTASRSNVTIQYVKWDLSDVTTGHACVSSSGGLFVTNITVQDYECLGPPVGQATSTASAMGIQVDDSGWVIRRGKINRWDSNRQDGDGKPGVHCFYWMGDNSIIEHNECSGIDGIGIQLYNSGSYRSDNNKIRYNTFYNMRWRGAVYVQAGTVGNQIYGNVIYNYGTRYIYTEAISVRGSGTKAYNNTIYNTSGASGIVSSSCSSCEIKNNIIRVGGKAIGDGGGTTISNNLTTDPMFVGAGNADFRLKAESPAINKGLAISEVATDMDGTSRPQGGSYDIGAYEYLSTTSSPPTSPSSLQATSQ